MSYDRALTVFSPDGHLFQVEYAMEAVHKGSSIVGLVAKDCIILGYERKNTAQLQDPRTVKKLLSIDENITFLFAGLNADARKLIDIARVEAQSFRASYDEIPTVQYIAKYLGRQQQLYTQRGGRRPFGVSAFICGIDRTGAHLFQTDPAGICTEWKVCELFCYYAIRQTPVVRVIRTFANTSRITTRRIWKKTKPLNSF